MRLIDADALEKKLHEFALDEWNQRATTSWSNAFLECEDIVYNAPTVEAIPIEWIKEWVNNYCDRNQEKLIEILLRTWNKTRRREDEID